MYPENGAAAFYKISINLHGVMVSLDCNYNLMDLSYENWLLCAIFVLLIKFFILTISDEAGRLGRRSAH
jgi:hypothetical protein